MHSKSYLSTSKYTSISKVKVVIACNSPMTDAFMFITAGNSGANLTLYTAAILTVNIC